MTVKKPGSARTLKSNLAKVDAHVIKKSEYRELPELTDAMVARAVKKKGGRPISNKVR